MSKSKVAAGDFKERIRRQVDNRPIHDDPEKELLHLREAREQCRRLAAEVQRLTEKNAELETQLANVGSGSRVYPAFYDIARMILSERTWRRILDLAEERAGMRNRLNDAKKWP
jgi:uncharacterized protein (DUF2342 family)